MRAAGRRCGVWASDVPGRPERRPSAAAARDGGSARVPRVCGGGVPGCAPAGPVHPARPGRVDRCGVGDAPRGCQRGDEQRLLPSVPVPDPGRLFRRRFPSRDSRLSVGRRGSLRHRNPHVTCAAFRRRVVRDPPAVPAAPRLHDGDVGRARGPFAREALAAARCDLALEPPIRDRSHRSSDPRGGPPLPRCRLVSARDPGGGRGDVDAIGDPGWARLQVDSPPTRGDAPPPSRSAGGHVRRSLSVRGPHPGAGGRYPRTRRFGRNEARSRAGGRSRRRARCLHAAVDPVSLPRDGRGAAPHQPPRRSPFRTARFRVHASPARPGGSGPREHPARGSARIRCGGGGAAPHRPRPARLGDPAISRPSPRPICRARGPFHRSGRGGGRSRRAPHRARGRRGPDAAPLRPRAPCG